MAHDLVLSGTTVAWYVTVVTNSRITYVLSVGSATIQNCRKTCFIVICAKGKKIESFHLFVSSSVHVIFCSAMYFEIQAFVIPVILSVLSAVIDGIKVCFYESERHNDVSGQKIRQDQKQALRGKSKE